MVHQSSVGLNATHFQQSDLGARLLHSRGPVGMAGRPCRELAESGSRPPQIFPRAKFLLLELLLCIRT